MPYSLVDKMCVWRFTNKNAGKTPAFLDTFVAI